MSLGWVFCKTCEKYRKWQECGDYDTLSCGHKVSDSAIVSKELPGYHTDDYFEIAEDQGRICEIYRRYFKEKQKIDCSYCGNFHVLGLTIIKKKKKYPPYYPKKYSEYYGNSLD